MTVSETDDPGGTTDVTDHSAAPHYDRVTPAWQYLLGDELHYGLFPSGAETLPEATAQLTRRMAVAADLRPGLRVLDVGCGTGAPACAIAAEHGVGMIKRDEFVRYADPVGLDLMRARKRTLDPADVLNPGKVIAPAGAPPPALP